MSYAAMIRSASGKSVFKRRSALESLPYTAVVIGARPAEAGRPLAPMMTGVAGRRLRQAPPLCRYGPESEGARQQRPIDVVWRAGLSRGPLTCSQ